MRQAISIADLTDDERSQLVAFLEFELLALSSDFCPECLFDLLDCYCDSITAPELVRGVGNDPTASGV